MTKAERVRRKGVVNVTHLTDVDTGENYFAGWFDGISLDEYGDRANSKGLFNTLEDLAEIVKIVVEGRLNGEMEDRVNEAVPFSDFERAQYRVEIITSVKKARPKGIAIIERGGTYTQRKINNVEIEYFTKLISKDLRSMIYDHNPESSESK